MADEESEMLADDVLWLARCRAVARDVIADAEWTSQDDPAELRDSLIRTRLAAAAERQAHESRGYVLDIKQDPATGAGRIIIATATGDRREERELLIDAVVAFDAVRSNVMEELSGARIVAFLLPWLLGGRDGR